MEEDIKILEEWLADNKVCCKNLFGESMVIPRKRDEAYKYFKQIKSLENLIKGYRELEYKLNQLNTYILINGIDERLKTATQIQVENQNQYLHQRQVEKLKERIEQLKENSIPKSKIQEKIEELEKDKKNLIYGSVLIDAQIGILKRLMEDK